MDHKIIDKQLYCFDNFFFTESEENNLVVKFIIILFSSSQQYYYTSFIRYHITGVFCLIGDNTKHL